MIVGFLAESVKTYREQFLQFIDKLLGSTVGTASPGHFYNMFKRRFGMTPNEYRRGKYPQG